MTEDEYQERERHVHPIYEEQVSGPEDNRAVRSVIEDVLKPLFGRSVHRFAEGDRIRWDLALFPLPSDQRDEHNQPVLVAMVMLYMEIDGAIMRSHISATRIMQAGGHSQESSDINVKETLDGLREARSKQLAQQQADADAAMKRGEQPPVSGLITLGDQPRPNMTFDDVERAVNGVYGQQ